MIMSTIGLWVVFFYYFFLCFHFSLSCVHFPVLIFQRTENSLVGDLNLQLNMSKFFIASIFVLKLGEDISFK